jgi:hypothetical protein
MARNTAGHVIAKSVGMDTVMKKDTNDKLEARSPRRAFFAQVLATAGGGLLAGGFLRGLMASRKSASDPQHQVNITVNPLAVPRTKESKSHV